MVQKKMLRCSLGDGVFMWLWCSPCSQGRELPQWILSHFHQAPPLADHTAAFKGLNEHQRQLCDFAFLSELYNQWSVPPPDEKSPAPFIPIAIFNDFPNKHSRFSGTVHHSGRVKWDTCLLLSAFWYEQPPLLSLSHTLSLFMMHMYLPWARGRVVWIRRQRARAWDNGDVCINDSVAGCSAQNIIYSSHWREITAAILSRSRKISWPGNT